MVPLLNKSGSQRAGADLREMVTFVNVRSNARKYTAIKLETSFEGIWFGDTCHGYYVAIQLRRLHKF